MSEDRDTVGPPDERLERYARNIALAEVGPVGQAKLASCKVLVVGLGGLGSPASLYLAAAGVGTIGLADPARVDLPDLQRQVLYSSSNIGHLKVTEVLSTRNWPAVPSYSVVSRPSTSRRTLSSNWLE